MVKLTIDMMVRKSSGKRRIDKEEPVTQFLSRLTHLYLEGKNIDETADEFTRCGNLTCLYLYDNSLSCIPNLKRNENITQLYLHNNNITKIENIGNLRYLEKLFIGYNKLIVLEGLENCISLKELHIENQKLEEGEFLVIDPRSISTLSQKLEVLNISGNGIESLEAFKDCIYLRDLIARNNQIASINVTTDALANINSLIKLDLSQNPISSQPKYRDKIIVVCKNLESLDGKDITDVSRKFLLNWQNSKDTIQMKAHLKNSTNNNNKGEYLDDSTYDADRTEAYGSYEINFNHPSYIMPAFPGSTKKLASKLKSNALKHELYGNKDTQINLNDFSINGSTSANMHFK